MSSIRHIDQPTNFKQMKNIVISLKYDILILDKFLDFKIIYVRLSKKHVILGFTSGWMVRHE